MTIWRNPSLRSIRRFRSSNGTPAVATVGAVGVDEFATGVAPGTSVITATLKPEVVTPSGSQRTASRTLTVVPVPPCTTPLLAANGALATTDQGSLCLGCSVDNPSFAIDALGPVLVHYRFSDEK